MEPQDQRQKIELTRAMRSRMYDVARQLRRSETRGEQLLWHALRNSQLDGRKFRRQQPIGPFVVDFYCVSERLIIEVDGPVHQDRRGHDAERQRIIESTGDRVLRIPTELVESNVMEALIRIREAFNRPELPLSTKMERGPGGEVP